MNIFKNKINLLLIILLVILIFFILYKHYNTIETNCSKTKTKCDINADHCCRPLKCKPSVKGTGTTCQ